MKQKIAIQNLAVLFAMLALLSPLGAVPYTDNGDGTISDSATGLVWQKCPAGLSGSSCGTGSATAYDWASALTYCKNLTLVSRSWRMPSINELKSILDRSKAATLIDSTVFPAAYSNYWSSTTYTSNIIYAWGISLFDGHMYLYPKTSSYNVRCVATGP